MARVSSVRQGGGSIIASSERPLRLTPSDGDSSPEGLGTAAIYSHDPVLPRDNAGEKRIAFTLSSKMLGNNK